MSSCVRCVRRFYRRIAFWFQPREVREVASLVLAIDALRDRFFSLNQQPSFSTAMIKYKINRDIEQLYKRLLTYDYAMAARACPNRTNSLVCSNGRTACIAWVADLQGFNGLAPQLHIYLGE